MTKDSFIQKLNSLDGNDLVAFIKQFGKDKLEIDLYIKQYDPTKHDVFDYSKRPDKPVRKPTGTYQPDGTQNMMTTIQPVTRIAVDAQQDITKNAAGILCANKIELKNTSQNISDLWNENRLDLKTISICSIWLSETEVAELWYKRDTEFKVMTLANSFGDKLYPVFDDLGDLICFGRSFKSSVVQDGSTELLDVNNFEIYTDTDVFSGNDADTNGNFTFKKQPHGFKKIPVVYASRDLPVWWNVQSSIDRFETSISNLCDTNDYFGSPTAVVKGKIISYADKGESGKILQIDPENPDAKIEYLTWNQAPESLKLEWAELQKIIRDSTRTISLTLDNLKGLFGSAPSAYAIKLLFTPAHLQAAEHEEVFGEYIQRRLNLMASFISGTPGEAEFNYYLPKDDKAELAAIISAKMAGILSLESAVEDSPLTVDKDIELTRIQDDQAKEEAKQTRLINQQNAAGNRNNSSQS